MELNVLSVQSPLSIMPESVWELNVLLGSCLQGTFLVDCFQSFQGEESFRESAVGLFRSQKSILGSPEYPEAGIEFQLSLEKASLAVRKGRRLCPPLG